MLMYCVYGKVQQGNIPFLRCKNGRGFGYGEVINVVCALSDQGLELVFNF